MALQEDWGEELPYAASNEPDAMDSMFVTFGAENVTQNGTFLNVNGDVTSTVNTTSTLVGNTFVVGEPVWFYRMTFHKSTETRSSITLLKIGTSEFRFEIEGRSNWLIGSRGLFFNRGDRLQLRVNVTSAFPTPGKILLTLFFRPLVNQNLRLRSLRYAGDEIIPSSSILTFGGNMKTAGACFNVNGDSSSMEIGPHDPGSVFVAGVPFTIHVVAWHSPTEQTSGIRFLKNGQFYGPSWGITGFGLREQMTFPYRYDAGDFLQIIYNGSTQLRRILIWIYVRPIGAYQTPNERALVDVSGQSIVTFGGNVKIGRAHV